MRAEICECIQESANVCSESVCAQADYDGVLEGSF